MFLLLKLKPVTDKIIHPIQVPRIKSIIQGFLGFLIHFNFSIVTNVSYDKWALTYPTFVSCTLHWVLNSSFKITNISKAFLKKRIILKNNKIFVEYHDLRYDK